jgi:hypothetical protein
VKTNGRKGLVENFSDLLAGDCTPILFLDKTDTALRCEERHRIRRPLMIDGKSAMFFTFPNYCLTSFRTGLSSSDCQCSATTVPR